MKPILLLPEHKSECRYMFSQWSIIKYEISIPSTSMEVMTTSDIKLPPIYQSINNHKKNRNIDEHYLPSCRSLIRKYPIKKLPFEHCHFDWIRVKSKTD